MMATTQGHISAQLTPFPSFTAVNIDDSDGSNGQLSSPEELSPCSKNRISSHQTELTCRQRCPGPPTLCQRLSDSFDEPMNVKCLSSDQDLVQSSHSQSGSDSSGNSCRDKARTGSGTRQRRRRRTAVQMRRDQTRSSSIGRTSTEFQSAGGQVVAGADNPLEQSDCETIPSVADRKSQIGSLLLAPPFPGPKSILTRAEVRSLNYHEDGAVSPIPRWILGGGQVESQYAPAAPVTDGNGTVVGRGFKLASADEAGSSLGRGRRGAVQLDPCSLVPVTVPLQGSFQRDANLADPAQVNMTPTTPESAVSRNTPVEGALDEEKGTQLQGDIVARTGEEFHGLLTRIVNAESDSLMIQIEAEFTAIGKLDDINALADKEISWLTDLKKENEKERHERNKTVKGLREGQGWNSLKIQIMNAKTESDARWIMIRTILCRYNLEALLLLLAYTYMLDCMKT